MKLKIYDWKRPMVTPPKSKIQTIGLNRHGRFVFSNAAVCMFDLKEGVYTAFAKDEDSKSDWYITFEADARTGSKIRFAHNGRENGGSMITNNKEAANALLDCVKADKGASFLISKSPKLIDGQTWYKILTAKPIRIK